jgi:hypothetical protein
MKCHVHGAGHKIAINLFSAKKDAVTIVLQLSKKDLLTWMIKGIQYQNGLNLLVIFDRLNISLWNNNGKGWPRNIRRHSNMFGVKWISQTVWIQTELEVVLWPTCPWSDRPAAHGPLLSATFGPLKNRDTSQIVVARQSTWYLNKSGNRFSCTIYVRVLFFSVMCHDE